MKKSSLLIIFIVSALLLSSLLSFTLYDQNAAAQTVAETWWNPNWSYARAVDFTERSGNSLVNFPVQVTFEHNGKTKTIGEDIRVVDSGLEVPSYVSEINNTHATVVFEINLTATTTKTIYIYYGNPSASKPSYALTPLTLSDGQKGYAIIDNSVYIGWDYTSWGWSNNVQLWNDFRIDFNGNKDPRDDSDLIRDYSSRQGGIGRHRADTQAIGLGAYQGYDQTPLYVNIKFADATLRIYRNNPWVETTQADCLHMFSESYDYWNYGGGIEQNIVDGQGINIPEGFSTGFWSKENPGWMAFRDSSSSIIFASTGLNIGSDYAYHSGGKEASDYDRALNYNNKTRYEPVYPYDQPPECRIYWYGDKSNSYSKIQAMSQIFNNQPLILVGVEIQGTTSPTDAPTNTPSPTPTLSPSPTPTATPNPSGLVGYWKLDEGSGTVTYDSSGFGNTGTLVGEPSWLDGKDGKALNFDGSSDYVSIPVLYSTSPSSITVSAWINSDLTKMGYVVYHGDNGEFVLHNGERGPWLEMGETWKGIATNIAGFTVKLTDNKIYDVYSTTSLTPNIWHHIVGAWTMGVSLKIYVDGVLAGENTAISNNYLFDPQPPHLPSMGVYSRAMRVSDTFFFEGTIDDVRIYSRALGPEEITSLYSANPIPTPTPSPTATPTPLLPSPNLAVSCKSSASYSGFNVEIFGNLTNDGVGLSGLPVLVSYSVDTGNSWNQLTSINTKDDGSFSAVWLPSVTGNYLIKATYSGNAQFSQATTIVNFAVTPFEEQSVFSVTSNSTLTQLAFNSSSSELSFGVSGTSGTTGYVNAYIPKSLMNDVSGLKVYLDGNQVGCTTESQNDYWLLYFTYGHSTHQVTITLSTITNQSSDNLFGNWMFYGVLVTVVIIIAVAAVLTVKRMKTKKQKTP